MKKIVYTIFALLVLASCSRLAEYTEIPFVYFSSPAVSVYEDAGEIEIPINVSSSDVAFSLTFETLDGEKTDATTGQVVPNGKSGVDYSVVDNEAAIIRFNEGESVKSVKVKITDFPGVLTGNKNFSIHILNAGSMVAVGGFSTCKVTIIDNDHPLKSIFGEYTATDADGNSWTVTLAEDPNSYNQVFFDGIVPTFAGSYVGQGKRHYVVAPVSDDLSTITIPLGYTLADQFNGHFIQIYGYEYPNSIYVSGTLSFNKTEDGYKLSGNRGFAAIYENDGYYLAASDATASAPITLVKK